MYFYMRTDMAQGDVKLSSGSCGAKQICPDTLQCVLNQWGRQVTRFSLQSQAEQVDPLHV